MTVYVDDARRPFGRMQMAHLVADSVSELDDMADAVGLKRAWFQNHPRHPHYDLCLANRPRLCAKVQSRFLAAKWRCSCAGKRNEQRSANKKRERGAAH